MPLIIVNKKDSNAKILILLALSVPAFAYADESSLTGDQLKEAVAGKTIYINSPMGEIPVRYAPNGTMRSHTELALMDGEDQTTDRGRWWINNDKLCLRWQNWMERKQYCFTMHKVGRSMVRWHRNDGKTGTARLG